jgi:hypothetical protein
VGIAAAARRHGRIALAAVAVVALACAIELRMGRLLLGPDGRLGLWEGDIWSSEQSQRLLDPYSFSHVVHGLLFYAVLWLLARRLPLRYRFLMATALEAGWEILENSPLIIERYRAVTIALGYAGDSVINSASDVLMMALGFFLASRLRVWLSVALVVGIELGCLFWIHDNLTLNILMLVHPIPAIRAWQLKGAPLG